MKLLSPHELRLLSGSYIVHLLEIITVINEGAEKCKYVVGDDANYLIEQVHASNDNCKLVDEAIMQIMNQYTPQSE